jgi:hypothetical protein
MGFAPQSGGEMMPYGFVPPDISDFNFDERGILSAKKRAHDFWECVARDERISDEFKHFLARGNPVDLMQ